MDTRWLAGGVGCGLAGILLAWSCSGQSPTPRVPPFAQRPLEIAPQKSADTAAIPEQDVASQLEHFAPLLSLPGLVEVQTLLDAGRDSEALSAFESVMGGPLKARSGEPEFLFQHGRLLARAERPRAAAVAFRASSELNWPLAAYSEYFCGRSLLAAGDPKAALAVLRRADDGLPFAERRELLLAEAAAATGQGAFAIEVLRGSLQRPTLEHGWAQRALLLADLLQRSATEAGRGTPAELTQLEEALAVTRRVSLQLAGSRSAHKAVEQEQQLLARLPAKEMSRLQPLSAAEQLLRLGSLIDARKYSDALVAADELMTLLRVRGSKFDTVGCEGRVLKNKALFGARKYTQAVDGFSDVIANCTEPDLLARALYLAGKYAAADKRHGQAVRHFTDLEKRAGTHRLADDARLLAARSYLALGDDANFTRLLSAMAEDYPQGDMVLDGVFELALHRIERLDWAGAALVLERGLALSIRADAVRDHEWAGRERYFLARARIELGETERGLADFESLIKERPLSYYMQHAYSRLLETDRPRALAAHRQAMEKTAQEPFRFTARPEFATAAFRRILALLRQGELAWATKELDLQGAAAQDSPELLWAIALLYNRAGSAKLSHTLARSKLSDWLGRWPAGDWEKAWQLAFPRPYRAYVTKASGRFELPESLIYAVMREESGFDAKVVSHADAYGLMQLIRPTAKHYGRKLGIAFSERALKTPRINIQLGAFVLKDFRARFPNNPILGIPGYNAGPGRPRRWLKDRPGVDFDVWVELIPFTETRRYAKRVLASRGAYAFLYESHDSENMLLPRRLHPEP